MKKISFFSFILLALLACILTGCERYDMATIEIRQDGFNDTTRIVNYTAMVKDDGGCAHCIEAGYCYSFIDTLPSHTSYYSTVVPLIYDSLMVLNDSTESYLTYSWSRQLPFIESAGEEEYDTLLYYFRSYVTTNAGTFYSKVDTVKVPRSY